MIKIDVEGVECISTGNLCEYAGFTFKSDYLLSLGLKPHTKIKAGLYWRVSDVPAILNALIGTLQLKLKEAT